MAPGCKIMSTLENLKVAIESCPVIGQSRKHRPKGATAIIDINANYISLGKYLRTVALLRSNVTNFNMDLITKTTSFSLPHTYHSLVIILFGRYVLQVIKLHFPLLHWIGFYRSNWSFQFDWRVNHTIL